MLAEEGTSFFWEFQLTEGNHLRFNREGDFVQASGRAEEILGLTKDEITDRTYNDPEWRITTPEGDPIPDDELPFARVISTEEPVYNIEHMIEWPDGTRRLLSVSGAPLTAANGELEGAVFHLEDITERRAAEQALRESEQRFRGVFENAAMGIALLDAEGQLLEVNPALAAMTGYEPDELQGHHFEDVTHPDDLEADQQRFGELVSGKRDQYQMEKRYVRKDETVFWGRLTVSRHDGTDEERIIGMVEDIDKQKRYEEQLRDAKETAEEASRLKSAMLANMSHEIRTPLTAVTGFSELLAEQLTGQSRDFALRIERSGKRLTKTLDSVLRLSELEAGAMNLKREPLRLDEVVQETLELLRSMAQEKSVEVGLSVPDGPVTGEWNEAALNRIIENLLENALKFTPTGGHVDLRVQKEEKEAVLNVEDTGIGIEEEAQARIFKAFEQESDGLDREYEGSGLGLSIVKELVEAHGGTITVDSEKGRGTCFTVRLPPTPEE